MSKFLNGGIALQKLLSEKPALRARNKNLLPNNEILMHSAEVEININKKTMPKNPVSIPTEHQEQCEIIRWRDEHLNLIPELKWLHAIPNGQAKTPFQRMKFKREGLTSGVADLFWPYARSHYSGIYLEIKRVRGGKLSDEQKEFIFFVNSQGYFVRVACGAQEAIQYLEQYISLPNK